ncbi:hypothetical protein [Aeromonas salmonicida]|uniref:hypothetical protein n=1 Tax=Aeromonas salmonicida TaxID=645 RepID=UPI0022409B28|nr:hypothetical protein [Aeromonas salmonicida]MDR6995130.1 hypothetical protein [Aeromonas salmonicida]
MRVQMIRGGWGLALLMAGAAQGATLNVTAEYNPAAYEAGGAKFINTTPCTQFPDAPGFWCSTTATVETPQAVRFDANIKRKVKESSDSREGVHYLGFPGARDVTLVKQGGGTSYTLKFIVTAVGSEMYVGSVPADTTISEKGDCAYASAWKNTSSIFVYRNVKEPTSASGGRCHGQNAGSVGKVLNVSSIYLGYKLKAPNPLAMENGTYTGKLALSMGHNLDFDFGAGTYTDTQLTVNFTIKVRHQIKVDFPAGGNRVVLQPPGGWHDWIYRGRNDAPSYLDAVLPARFWVAVPYRVSLSCQYLNTRGDGCQIKNDKNNHKVPVKVYGTGIRNQEWPVYAGKTDIYAYHKVLADSNRPFRFVVENSSVKEMMKYAGSTYRGDITIIIDVTIN